MPFQKVLWVLGGRASKRDSNAWKSVACHFRTTDVKSLISVFNEREFVYEEFDGVGIVHFSFFIC
jgi:hypothetical protein